MVALKTWSLVALARPTSLLLGVAASEVSNKEIYWLCCRASHAFATDV